jgi:hypothetical protein
MRPVRLLRFFLLVALATFTLVANAQSEWPRNLETNEIEFAGSLPWPPEAKTVQQRQALVRRWYERRLSSDKIVEVEHLQLPPAKTCCGVPNEAYLRHLDGELHVILGYSVRLIYTSAGLTYYFSDLMVHYFQDDTGGSIPLSIVLQGIDKQLGLTPSLTVLQARLVKATAGW